MVKLYTIQIVPGTNIYYGSSSLCPTGEATDDDGGTPSKLGSPISQAKSEVRSLLYYLR